MQLSLASGHSHLLPEQPAPPASHLWASVPGGCSIPVLSSSLVHPNLMLGCGFQPKGCEEGSTRKFRHSCLLISITHSHFDTKHPLQTPHMDADTSVSCPHGSHLASSLPPPPQNATSSLHAHGWDSSTLASLVASWAWLWSSATLFLLHHPISQALTPRLPPTAATLALERHN